MIKRFILSYPILVLLLLTLAVPLYAREADPRRFLPAASVDDTAPSASAIRRGLSGF